MPSPNCLKDLESPLLLPCPPSLLLHFSSSVSGAAFGALPPTGCVGRASVGFLIGSDCQCWPWFRDWEAWKLPGLSTDCLGEGVQCQSWLDFRTVRADHWSLVCTCAPFSNTRDCVFPGFFKENQRSPLSPVYYESCFFQLLSHNTRMCRLAHFSLFTILPFILSEEK